MKSSWPGIPWFSTLPLTLFIFPSHVMNSHLNFPFQITHLVFTSALSILLTNLSTVVFLLILVSCYYFPRTSFFFLRLLFHSSHDPCGDQKLPECLLCISLWPNAFASCLCIGPLTCLKNICRNCVLGSGDLEVLCRLRKEEHGLAHLVPVF